MIKGRLPLDNAKNLIIEALECFDPALGGRAAAILFDETKILDGHARAHIVEVERGQVRVMACRPSGITHEDLVRLGMNIPDYTEEYGPDFTRQDNPTDHAIIDFHYDGTYGGSVWLAHELGHAIADDIQRENGRSYKDYTVDEMEHQAFFVQRIYSQYLREKLGMDARAADRVLDEDVSQMSSTRVAQFNKASAIYRDVFDEPSGKREVKIAAALDQRFTR